VLLGAAFNTLLRAPDTPRVASLVLLTVASAIAVVPAFLRGTRSLEIAAARALLDVDLPDPAPPDGLRTAPETRLRAALWYAVHLVIGGVVGLALMIALPMALIFILERLGVASGATAGFRMGPLDEHDIGWLSLIGVLMLLAIVYAVAGLGALAAIMAPVLLGPSPTERIAALEARADELAERNRLARELHDSVGHALAVAVVQAGAAREVLDRDPEFVRRALTAIEDAGRRASDDLDHVLGLLREAGPVRRTPQPTLADLDALVADARGAGLTVDVSVAGPLGRVPPAVSREGYRIVQEGLTNAVRHAGGAPVTLRLALSEQALDIALSNPVNGRGPERSGGHGLAGMRERVGLLGGRMSVDAEGGEWRVAVRLPVGRGRP
jgi:signal transduction histidine kinase